jgi:Putative metal-binding motif
VAQVTNSNTSCLSPILKWPILEATKNQLASRYPQTFPMCLDQDADTVVKANDCDDTRNDVFPGASERADGVDNDCNGVIDEAAFVESTFGSGDFPDTGSGQAIAGFPLRLEGRLVKRQGANDIDLIRLALPENRSYKAEVCVDAYGVSVQATSGTVLLQSMPNTFNCQRISLTAERPWSALKLLPSLGARLRDVEPYTLQVWADDPQLPGTPALTIERESSGALKAHVNVAEVPGGLDGVELVWVSNSTGELQRRPLAEASSLIWHDQTVADSRGAGTPPVADRCGQQSVSVCRCGRSHFVQTGRRRDWRLVQPCTQR